jgi:thymidylate synthase (FAD)
VTEDSFDYVIPPSINESPEALEIFSKALEAIQTAYNELRGILAPEFEKQLIAEGQTEKKAKDNAEKMANEDARFVLPNATETKLVFTMNARELLHFFGQRCCNRAQWEIRSLAEEMVVILKPIAPTIFKNAGPPCLRGACPEGSMSCGKQAQVALRYKMLDERL